MASQTNGHATPPGRLLYPQPNSPAAKKSLQDVLEALRRGKWFVLAVLLLTLIGAGVYTIMSPPQYSARSLLLVSTESSSGASDALAIIEGTGINDRNLTNQVLILEQSLLIAERTAERLLEAKTVLDTGEPLSVLEDYEEELPSPTELAILLQDKYVDISIESEDADAIWIAATSAIPAEAAFIANTYAEEYVKRTTENSRKHITASRQFLEDQISRHRSELDGLENEVKQYMSREGAVALDEASAHAITQIAQTEAFLDETRIEGQMHTATLQSLQQELEAIMPRLVERIASGAQTELEQTRTALAELEQRQERIYFRNPELREDPSGSKDLQDLQEQIAQTRRRIRELSVQYIDEALAVGGSSAMDPSLSLDYANQVKRQITQEEDTISALAVQEKALEERLANYSQKLQEIPAQSIELAQLQRAQQSSEQLYIRLVEKLQETSIAEEAEVGYAEIIRPALTPEEPDGAGMARNLLIGIVLGLVLGVGAALARQKLDTRIYTPDDLKEYEFEMLGTVPDMRPMITNQFQKKPKVVFEGREISSALAPLLNPFSPVAEAYRRLYTNLQFSHPDKVAQTILVTSAEAEVGKSTTALNLAITAARAGRRTLIIDADLRSPSLHGYLGITPRVDLEELLQKRATDLDAESFSTNIDNVYAILTRSPASSPAELLGSTRMRILVERLRSVFDVIILDTPPVLVATDATLLSTQCDAAVVVASSGSTDAEALRQTLTELQGVGAAVSGVVLNRFDPSHVYGYKHTYGYRQNSYYKYMNS